jgi:peptidoglycan/xylan/chitin deacetylase (PgdA/CDA1 family)
MNPAIADGLAALSVGGVAFGGCAWRSIVPQSQFWGPVISRGGVGAGHRYALTFDDGPTAGGTDRILDGLAELNVKAAFFVVGVNVRRSPDLLLRMRDEGHLIGNHTFDHSHYGMMRGPYYWQREIDETDRIVREISGVRMTTFRPPMGVKTWFVHRAARRAGHRVVTWNRRAYDGIPTTTDRILDRLVPDTAAGDILMLHDGVEPNRPRDMSVSVAAVRPLVQRLRERGLEPARLDELIGSR